MRHCLYGLRLLSLFCFLSTQSAGVRLECPQRVFAVCMSRGFAGVDGCQCLFAEVSLALSLPRLSRLLDCSRES